MQDVLTQHNDIRRTGCYHQPGLNQGVFATPGTWEQLGTLAVRGAVYAQPLFVSGLDLIHQTPGGRVHDVVYIATALNYVYAFDAATLRQLWSRHLGPHDDGEENPASGIQGRACAAISPVEYQGGMPRLGIGIQSTPVIDRLAGRMYVSYRTIDPSLQGADRVNSARQVLQAVDIRTGADLGEVAIRGEDFRVDFPVVVHRQRASLLLFDGVVYVAFASRCEDPPAASPPGNSPVSYWDYHGWVFAYDAQTLHPVGAFNATPGRKGGGIWQASGGLAADEPTRSVFLMTGNFIGDGSVASTWPDRSGRDLANSFIRLHAQRSADGRLDLSVADWFTPYRASWQNEIDLDLGSAGPLLVPGSRLLIGGGKEGVIYVLDRQRLGHHRPWSEWVVLGGHAQSGPAAARNSGGGLDLFLIDPAGVMWHRRKPGPASAWEAWKPFGGHLGGTPAVGTNPDGALEVFARGVDGRLWHKWQIGPGGPWTIQWSEHDGLLGGDPVVARNQDGRLEVFARGTDGSVIHKWKVAVGGAWSGWASLGGQVTDTPAVAAAADGRLEVFARGVAGDLIHLWQVVPNGAWTATPFSHGGAIVDSPTASWSSDHRIEVFARGTDGLLKHIWQTAPNGGWTAGFFSHPGPIAGPPSSGRNADGRIEVFTPAPDGSLLEKVQNYPSGSWDGWRTLNGQVTGAPAVGQNGDGRLELFARQPDGQITVLWQPLMPPYTGFVPDAPAADRVLQKFQAGENQYLRDVGQEPPMNDWFPWPHIHGSPVYAEFPSGAANLYVWPEKDCLKAFRRVGDQFSPAGQSSERAPDRGMPGGMLSISVDDARPSSGVLFASVPRDATGNIRGKLYAYDPITLRPLWNNLDHNPSPDYLFAKFCPPTIAGNLVFLATFSNEVRVYGPRSRFLPR